MAPVEQLQGRLGARLVDVFDTGEQLLDRRLLGFQVIVLGSERHFVDLVGNIGVKRSVLHPHKFAELATLHPSHA